MRIKNIYKKMYHESNPQKIFLNPRVHSMKNMIYGLHLEGKNILDIGPYDGTLLSLIKGKNNLFALEASAYGVKQCRKKGIKTLQFFFGGTKKLPYKNGQFDLVIAGEIIEHIYDTDFFLTEIQRILKNKGYLILSSPNLLSFSRRIMGLFGLSPFMEVSPNEKDSVGHIRYFTFSSLEKLLVKHHFSMIKKQSDLVNFSNSGTARSYLLARIFPTLGQSIIMLTQNNI